MSARMSAFSILILVASCFPVRAATAPLEGPYEDPLQQDVPFGRRSYYLAPWRAYMDTWPASRFLDCLGLVWNGVKTEEAEPLARIMRETGIRSVRVEIGWGSFRYDDPSKLPDHADRHWKTLFAALAKHGVRPIILLNANSGWPCPIRGHRVKLLQDAPAGAREVEVDTADGILPFYSGLHGQAYQTAFPRVVKVGPAGTGGGEGFRLALSAPLVKAVKAGPLQINTQRFQPFAGPVFADGTPNPAARETLDGWMAYVAAICRLAKDGLGTTGKPDAGFDLEVWNEYSFGSHFLEDRHYYEPDRKYAQPVTYSRHGRTRKGHEIVLPMTIDWVNDPRNGCPGVRVIDGFANQRPWESGTRMWPGQAGFSRHYYAGTDTKAYAPDTLSERDRKSGPLNALGKPDGKPDGKDWHTVVPGTFFVPTHVFRAPEYWHHAYQTEFMTRDLQPFPGPWKEHHRYGHPGTGRIAEVWKTESNYWRWPFAERLQKEAKADPKDPRYTALLHAIGAKALLRIYTFESHKGVHTITVYNVKGKDTHFAVVPEAFFAKLKEAGHELTDAVRAAIGPQLTVVRRVAERMRRGKPVGSTRRLSVTRLVEHDPVRVFRGDGTPAHPDRWHRDDFACLPFQLAADRFLVGYYVLTRDALKVWDPSKGPLDPDRYAMPPQRFDLTLTNVRGAGAKVSAWDPMTDRMVPVEVLKSGATSLTVRLPAVDHPRFLEIREAAAGPLVLVTRIRRTRDGVEVAFKSPVTGKATVTGGAFPKRSGGAERAVGVGAGREAKVVLPGLGNTDAVRVTVEAAGLVAQWPQWDHDVQGVLGWVRPEGGVADGPPPARTLPALPAGRRPRSGEARLPDGKPWPGHPPRQVTSIGKGKDTVQAVLERLSIGAEDVVQVLPPESALDTVTVSVVDWGGFKAWKAVCALDPAAHPGERDLAREVYLVPLREGFLILTFRAASAEALEAHRAQIDAVRAGVDLKGPS